MFAHSQLVAISGVVYLRLAGEIGNGESYKKDQIDMIKEQKNTSQVVEMRMN